MAARMRRMLGMLSPRSAPYTGVVGCRQRKKIRSWAPPGAVLESHLPARGRRAGAPQRVIARRTVRFARTREGSPSAPTGRGAPPAGAKDEDERYAECSCWATIDSASG